MQKLTIAGCCALFFAACSGDAGTASQNNGTAWEFDMGIDGSTSASNNGAQNNGAQNNGVSNNGAQNNGVANNGNNGGTTGPSNNGAVDAGPAPDDAGTSGGIDAGMGCSVNSDCGANLICCQGFDGQATCQEDCFSGGLCGGDASECARGEECCDLSSANLPDTCLDRCRGGGGGGGGNMGTPCMTNPDCTGADEVCCIGFDGQGTCEPTSSCFTGGACAADADCNNGQLCCDFNVAKVCLDRCNF